MRKNLQTADWICIGSISSPFVLSFPLIVQLSGSLHKEKTCKWVTKHSKFFYTLFSLLPVLLPTPTKLACIVASTCLLLCTPARHRNLLWCGAVYRLFHGLYLLVGGRTKRTRNCLCGCVMRRRRRKGWCQSVGRWLWCVREKERMSTLKREKLLLN